MSVQISDEQRKLIKKIAEEHGFNEYEVIANPGSEKGDNFMGVLTAVTIKNDEKKLELYLKAAIQNEAARKTLKAREIYIREISIYEKVLKAFKTFQEDHNILDPFISFPKMYGSSIVDGNEIFVMENLKIKGFELWEKKLPMNDQHISAVLKEYAKFHAISFAMKHKNPELFEETVKQFKTGIWEVTSDPEGQNQFKQHIKNYLDQIIGENDQFQDVIAKHFDKLDFNRFYDPEFKLVMCHGDCWCNNFMFNYKDDNTKTKPTSLKILDWQIAHITSPAYDFIYFFFVESPEEILFNYKKYMKLYYDILSRQLENFGCNPEDIYPFSRFEKHIKAFMSMGLFTSIMILRIMLCESEEAPDFSELKDETEIFNKMSFETKNLDAYKERIFKILWLLKKVDTEEE